MSSTFIGQHLRLSIFGQSHSDAVGMTLDGLPAGIPVDLDRLQGFLNRRAPGQNDWSTPRKEEDRPEFLCGLKDGSTCGAPLTAIIRNSNTRPRDYSQLKITPRPGHADYTAEIKFDGFQDNSGGGHFSGRLTAPLCIAGGVVRQELRRHNSTVDARIAAIAGGGFAVLGMLMGLILIIRKLILRDAVNAGWTSLVALMLLLFGILMMMMGLVGEYVGRIFVTMNRSPQYVIRYDTRKGEPPAEGGENRPEAAGEN